MPTTSGSPDGETIFGDQFADKKDVINGLGGNDTLYGGFDNDVLYGGADSDTLYGGLANDILYGDDGSADAADTLYGGAGVDRLYGGGGNDVFGIEDTSDIVAGEQWYGGAGYDTIQLPGGFSTIDLTGVTFGNDIEALSGGLDVHLTAAQFDGLTSVSTLDNQVTLTTGGTANMAGATFLPDNIYLAAAGNVLDLSSVSDFKLHSVYGANGSDSVYGGNSSPLYAYGGGGSDTLRGGTASDLLYGDDGNDTLYGSASGSTLFGGHGADTFYGGDATDYIYAGAPGDTQDIEKVYGGAGYDILYAGGDPIDISKWTITGLEEIDATNVKMKAAQLDGLTTLQLDRIELSDKGAISLGGCSGAVQTFQLSAYGDSIDFTGYSGSGYQVLGASSNDVVVGNANLDLFYGGGGNDQLYGGAGADTLDGGTGSDYLSGGAGTDLVTYATSAVRVAVSLAITSGQNTAGSGNDTLISIENLTGSNFNDMLTGDGNANVISGLAGNDIIAGGNGANTLFGGDGNDTVGGGSGSDAIYGGAGTDLASYAAATGAVQVSLLFADASQATGGGGTDTLSSIEGLIGSTYDDALTGDNNANALHGGNGNDVLQGGSGNDSIDGGLGNDTASYSDAGSAITISLATGSPQNTGGSGIETLTSIENLIGSSYNDMLKGNDAANILYGGEGNDTLIGGLANDSLYGGNGIDTVSYSDATGPIKINLALTTQQSTISAGGDVLIGFENVIGSAYDDQLAGNSGDNILTGQAGNDLLIGGIGSDTLNGGAGIDTASFATATFGVTANIGGSGALFSGAGYITFLSVENLTGSAQNDVLTGSAQANIILGGNGDDVIDGSSGNDTVQGGSGNDTIKGGGNDDVITGNFGTDIMSGGSGNDTFVYLSLNDSGRPDKADRITDFASGDKLDLSAIDANASAAGDQAFHLAAAFTHTAGEYTIAFDTATNTTTALFDTNGDATSDMAILFTGNVTALTASWIL